MTQKRTVEKITPADYRTFDQQFWPVVVGLTVLCGIGIGAIITLLRGPWLWGSLLALPTMIASAIYFLYQLDDSKLRRSLQLATISSLALHLLFLILTSVIYIFRVPDKDPPQAVATKPPRMIEISDRRASFVWEEPNKKVTPEPTVEQVREKTTTDMKPQPVVVKESTPSPNPQIVKRETPVESIPRLDQALSELRRQTENFQPKSSRSLLAEIAKTDPNSSTETASAKSTESARKETSEARPVENASAEIAARASNDRPSVTERTKPVPTETKPEVILADSSPQRARPNQLMEQSAARSAPSPALRTSATPSLTQAQPKSNVTEADKAVAERQFTLEPSPVATELTRRPNPGENMTPSIARAKEATLSRAAHLATSSQRVKTEQLIPSITSETSQKTEPRRSTIDSPVTSTQVAIEKPSQQAESTSNTAELNPRTLSVSRSTEGVAGAGRSANLESSVGGATSPATKPSDAAARVESQSARSELRQLVASDESSNRRSMEYAARMSSVLKAETDTPSKVAGAATPSEISLESSAARIESATSERREQVSVERGSASVDLGPTKVLPDKSESTRRSGGGRTEVAKMTPEFTQRSRTTGDQQPSLAAKTASVSEAPSSQSAAPVSSDIAPNAEATLVSKTGGISPTTLQLDRAKAATETSNAGQSPRATELSDLQPRAKRGAETVFEMNPGDELSESQSGAKRAEISAAPAIKGDSGLGGFENPMGSSRVHSEIESDAPGEAKMELQRMAQTVSLESGLSKKADATATESISNSVPKDSTAPRRSEAGMSDIGSKVQANPIMTPNNARKDTRVSSNNLMPSLSRETAPMVAFEEKLGQSEKVETTAIEGIVESELEMTRARPEASETGSALEIVAIEGPVGLASKPADSMGLMVRPSDKESLQIQSNPNTRFRNPDFGGKPAINPDAVIAQEAFRNRAPSAMAAASEPSTEAAIQLGLEFLARHQGSDGSWTLGNFDRDHPQQAGQLNSDHAATALALLAFQGAGYNHREFQYASVVRNGIFWLMENQQDNGCLYIPSDKKSNESCRMYSHGIATLALTEAYGMTQDPRIKDAAQRAIDYIIKTQHPQKGGWRYFDQPGVQSTDTSVSGWMMMALHSGRLVGLNVDEKVFDGIDNWLNVAVDPDDPSKFRYNPYAVDADGVSRSHGKRPTAPMTAVGLLMKIYSGLDPSDPILMDGANWLALNHLPSDATTEQRDTYYWYYATQVLKYVDGPVWEKWDQRLRPLLIQSQVKSGDMAGSWHPYNPIPDRWGSFGGRLYVTTMNLLSLEVRHRMLPLYQKTNQPEK